MRSVVLTGLDENSQRISLTQGIFADGTNGRIVVAQAPNVWLWIFIAALAASFFVKPPGPVYTIVKTVGYGILAVWALD